MSSAPETLVHIHIQKTGGTTLRQFLRRAAGDGFHLVRGGPDRDIRASMDAFRTLPVHQRRHVTALCGHFPYGAHEWLPQPARYTTMLRDPVERLVSHFHYIRSSPRDKTHDIVAAMSLAEFAESRPFAFVDNGITRLLAGRQDFGQVRDFGSVTTADVERAKRHLDSFAVVGLTERFDESLDLFRRVMGWTTPTPKSRRVNESRPSIAALPAAERALVRDACTFDLELYEYSVELFARQARERPDEPGDGPGPSGQVGDQQVLL